MVTPAAAQTWAAGDAQTVYQAFDQLSPMVAVFTGPDHVWAAGNAACRAWIGDRDFLGRPLRDVFPEIAGQQVAEALDRVYERAQPETVREWRVQLDIDLEGAVGEFFTDTTLAPLRDADGEVYGLTAVFTDVTDRVRQRQVDQQRAVEAERRYQAARDVVAELQEALLPTALPVLPGVTVAARYLVAAQDQAAGGDWFDAVPLADGRVALVVGDIVGHGVAASAAMGQLRAVLGRALVETHDLHQALGWVDRLAGESSVMTAATLCVLVLDPASGAACYATCGHPPPLVVTAGGAARFLPPSGGAPLGTGAPVTTATAELAPGDLVLLYSDGLVERAGELLEQRMQTLAAVAGDAVANRALPLGAPSSAVERASHQCVEIMARGGFDDDVTVLVAQRRAGAVPVWRAERPATPSELPSLRGELNSWLDLLEASPQDRRAIDIAVTELAANVVEHAYPGGSTGPIRLRARLTPTGEVTVEVADHGAWRAPGPPAATRGRGLWLAGAVVDELTVVRRGGDVTTAGDGGQPPDGTVVTLRHRLAHPARLAAGAGPASVTPRVGEFAVRLDEGPPLHVRVQGSIDITTAGELAERLDLVSRGGLHPLTVDLDDVDLLASAGVAVLFDLRDRLATHGQPLSIVATDQSPAQQVLDLVGLDRLPHVR